MRGSFNSHSIFKSVCKASSPTNRNNTLSFYKKIEIPDTQYFFIYTCSVFLNTLYRIFPKKNEKCIGAAVNRIKLNLYELCTALLYLVENNSESVYAKQTSLKRIIKLFKLEFQERNEVVTFHNMGENGSLNS